MKRTFGLGPSGAVMGEGTPKICVPIVAETKEAIRKKRRKSANFRWKWWNGVRIFMRISSRKESHIQKLEELGVHTIASNHDFAATPVPEKMNEFLNILS